SNSDEQYTVESRRKLLCLYSSHSYRNPPDLSCRHALYGNFIERLFRSGLHHPSIILDRYGVVYPWRCIKSRSGNCSGNTHQKTSALTRLTRKIEEKAL